MPARPRRVVVLGLTLLVALAVLLARPLHDQLVQWLAAAQPLIREHPALGKVVFVALAAISALLAFFSSALLVPVAVYTWGRTTCVVLLWAGWLIGCVLAYAIGRRLGRPVVQRVLPAGALARYEGWIEAGTGFLPVFLLQLAIPSDVAGYLFGLVRCRFRIFLPAVAAAELPYAVGAVYLGASFLDRSLGSLLVVGVAGLALSAAAARILRDRHERKVGGRRSRPVAASTRRARKERS